MYKRVFDIHAWKLSTHAFNEGDIRLYESLTSIGNGYMGMRGNFEEGFSGDSHTGTYIAGIWFPDKTRVDSVKLTFRRFFSIVERRTAEFQLIIEGKAYTLTSRLTNACAE